MKSYTRSRLLFTPRANPRQKQAPRRSPDLRSYRAEVLHTKSRSLPVQKPAQMAAQAPGHKNEHTQDCPYHVARTTYGYVLFAPVLINAAAITIVCNS